jgi:hypothetical protein
MRCQRLSRLHLLLIMPLTLLVFSARLTWTQERPSGSKIRFHPAYENLSLPFANHGQAPSQARFSSGDIGYHFSVTKNNTLPELWQLAKIDAPQAKANHFIGNAPTEWFTNVIPNTAHYRTPSGYVQFYGRRIPWAGRIILSLGEQAKIHPRATRVLWLIDPHLRFENRLPRPWIGR